ncbi:MAG: hypothetical protein ACK5OS_16125 [Chryseotalea sp.]
MKTVIYSTSCFVFIMLISIHTLAQKQGVKGKITLLTGNQMPGPDKMAKPKGVKRTIWIYLALEVDLNQATNGFISKPKQKPIKKIQSNKRGYFKTTLPPGHYSLLIQEGEKLWGNQFNEQMIINPFTVVKHQVLEFNVEINHSAYF